MTGAQEKARDPVAHLSEAAGSAWTEVVRLSPPYGSLARTAGRCARPP